MSIENPKVLIVVVRAGPKSYAFDFHPHFAMELNCPNSKILLVDEKNCKELRGETIGELIAAKGRHFGIEFARKHDFDYIYFLDLDLKPDPSLLNALLSLNYPLAGSLTAARGDSYLIIGHNNEEKPDYIRKPLYYPDLKDGDMVDGIGGCSLLVNKVIFRTVDYTGYVGPNTIPNRFTADDEYFQIKIWEKLGIKPKIIKSVGGWHYNDDGYRYRLLGKKEKY